jgi:hypothetical protein
VINNEASNSGSEVGVFFFRIKVDLLRSLLDSDDNLPGCCCGVPLAVPVGEHSGLPGDKQN